MSNKKFNPDAAFQSIVQPHSTQSATEENAKSESAVIKPETVEVSKKKPSKPKLIQTGFYITEKQHKALKIKAIEDDSDQSQIIRDLIDEHLKKYIK